MKIHIGPGPKWKKPSKEWITIDAEYGDIIQDFNRTPKLPFAEGVADTIMGSHVFEHISIFNTPILFRSIHSTLAEHGTFHLAIPDVRKSIEAYLDGETDYPLFKRRKRRNKGYTIFECLREDFLSPSGQWQGELAHQNAWDWETIYKDLKEAGFERITRRRFENSIFKGIGTGEALQHDRTIYISCGK